MNKNYSELLDILRNSVGIATGCTEPIAVAYAASAAGKRIKDISQIEKVELCVDSGLFKNALRVGVPGTDKRGIEIAAALGLVIGKPEKELQILQSYATQEREMAETLAEKVRFAGIKGNCSRLFIEVIVTMKDGKQIKVVTLDRHNNIVEVQEGIGLEHEDLPSVQDDVGDKPIQKYDFKDILDFSVNAPIGDIEFLMDGVKINSRLAEEGLRLSNGIGSAYQKFAEEGFLTDDMITRAESLCSSASEARMSGSLLPAMSCAGSGNHGITLFLTIAAIRQKAEINDEKMIRALALGCLITVYIKSFTGALSAMCGCGVAAGIGASAGVAYMMGGTEEQIFKSMLNMVGSITGLICDGAKEGCSFKLALSSGWAVKSALLALRDVSIHEDNGILSAVFKELFENLGYVCNVGMADANHSILDIMGKKKGLK